MEYVSKDEIFPRTLRYIRLKTFPPTFLKLKFPLVEGVIVE